MAIRPQFVFVPTRLNLPEIVAAYDLAAALGCSAFVTGPLMRIGRAAAAWDTLACTDDEWQRAVAALRERAATVARRSGAVDLPWDIVTEMETRLENPQAMLLVVPNGKVKLLNALPFAPADLRRDSLHDAWQAYRAAWRTTEVRDFVAALPRRAGAAAPRQRDLGPALERLTRCEAGPPAVLRWARIVGAQAHDSSTSAPVLESRLQEAAGRVARDAAVVALGSGDRPWRCRRPRARAGC